MSSLMSGENHKLYSKKSTNNNNTTSSSSNGNNSNNSTKPQSNQDSNNKFDNNNLSPQQQQQSSLLSVQQQQQKKREGENVEAYCNSQSKILKLSTTDNSNNNIISTKDVISSSCSSSSCSNFGASNKQAAGENCIINNNSNNNLSDSINHHNQQHFENGTRMDSNNLNNTNDQDHQIDESLYSRQLYVLGHDAMKRMAKSSILIAGAGGLGIEIAKNIILGGVKEVTLHDNKVTTFYDLSSQYYLSESSIGQNRAHQSLRHLIDLNPNVIVNSHQGELNDPEFLQNFTVVVLTDSSLEEQLSIAEIAHEKGIALIVAQSRGLFGQIFCDFGNNFTVYDTNGENPISVLISGITKEKNGVVACVEETRHGFEDGDVVKFSEVKGMTEINGKEYKIRVTGPCQFAIGDTTSFSDYVNGGIVTQVKQPKVMNFKPLKESILAPQFLDSFSDRPQQEHLLFQALDRFQVKFGNYPRSWNDQDADQFFELLIGLVNERQVEPSSINEKLAKIFAKQARGNLMPVNSFIGGCAAQEVMKACTGKFTPIYQWMYYDAYECLPFDEPTKLPKESDTQPINCRYDGQIAVFGFQFQNKLSDLRYFLVGAGAIGCEHLKHFAMIGAGTSDKGQIFVTDMDVIEKSNLNRQFLFRPKDVGSFKSRCAALATKAMNPQINIVSHENRVGPETEKYYNDDFFESLNGVANALDNLEARTYMDRKCVYYRIPLLESGTLGTKGNVQVVIPYLTESYSSSQDPPEKSIPICTLKHFPNSIEHTLQWALEEFEGLFKFTPEQAYLYLTDPKFIERTSKMTGEQPIQTLEAVKKVIKERPNSLEDCIKWARIYFELQFNHQIKQLLYNFPPDYKTTTGAPFWAGPKKCPHPIEFDLNNPLHVDFVMAAANLRAYMYNIPQCGDRRQIIQFIKQIPENELPKFVPKTNLKIAMNDSELNSMDSNQFDLGDRIKLILSEIPKPEDCKIKINPVDFEKDDDSNFHLDFIVAASNLRAENYEIQPADRHKSKLIAGRIIPAIATTTALISGLVFIEFYKLVQEYQILDPYMNSFVNLALPFFGFSTPTACQKLKYYDKEFTIWDRFELNQEMTLQEFIDYFKNVHRLHITMISQGNVLLYSFFLSKEKREERMALKMTEVLERVSKKRIEPHVKSLVFEICCNDDSGEDVEVPYVRYVLPQNNGGDTNME